MTNYSRQREAIVRILSETSAHPTAEEIYQSVKLLYPKISLATVYRNLRQLATDDDIVVLHTEDNKEHFDANTFPHAHLYCADCHRVSDLVLDINQIAHIRSIQPDAGFELNFYGVCETCRAKNK